MDSITNSLVSKLSVMFQKGVPHCRRVYAKENAQFMAKFKDEYDDYHKTETLEAANQFLGKTYDKYKGENPICTRENFCTQEDCTMCINLYGIFLALRIDLLDRRKKAFQSYLVKQNHFLLNLFLEGSFSPWLYRFSFRQ